MISIEGLTKYYKDFCALNGVSFEIRKGEILGLLGPNGAGKTTTLRILTCYMQPSGGSIKVNDADINVDPLAIKKMIGYLPESAPLYKDMIVYDYLEYVAGIRGIVKERRFSRIDELSDICGLKEVMHKPINELSKGYKQRVGLAHAMIGDPEILVLDEPTSGLDPNQIVEIRELIKKIGKQKTVVLSTHILSEVEATCDRVVIINRGRIVADNTTEEIKRSHGNERTIQVVLDNADESDVSRTLEGVSGVTGVKKTQSPDSGTGFLVTYSGDRDLRPDVYRAVKSKDWTLLSFSQETKTLENIFRELTKEN